MNDSLCVYLFGWFGYRNLGDDLLLEVMLDRLSAASAVGDIEVAVANPDYLAGVFERYPKAHPSTRSFRRLFSAPKNADLLIVGPGGLFPHSDPKKVAAFTAVTGTWRLRGRDVAFFLFGANARQGALSRALWRRIESMTLLFIPRDVDLIEAVGMTEDEETFAAADAVFSLDAESFFRSCEKENDVAFCFANLFEDQGRDYCEFVLSCAEIVRSSVALGCKPVLFSFTAGADERLNFDIAKQVGGDVGVLDYEQTLSEVRFIRRYRLVVGMRFHACVLSLLARVPLVPITYSSKTERLIRDCGMDRHMSFYCNSLSAYYGKIITIDKEFVIDEIGSALRIPSEYVCDESISVELRRRSLVAFEALKAHVKK